MSLDTIVIERANLGDADGILKLAQPNEEKQGGTLSGHLDRAVLIATLGQLPGVVARENGQIVGFLLTWEKKTSNSPIVRMMLAAYPGCEDAYLYGPVCVDAAMRGRGLAGAMFRELRRLLPDREGILFIRANNKPSLLAHRKMGMQTVAEFTYEGNKYFVLAYH
jgi:ribosomal protein S18 acetylase RimI-like enzyme